MEMKVENGNESGEWKLNWRMEMEMKVENGSKTGDGTESGDGNEGGAWK